MNSQFWKGKKVLLTGHTGFKGSWLSSWLKNLDVDLIGFSKSIPTKPSIFESVNVENKMISIMGDVRDLDKIKEIIKEYKPEIVIHMAAQSLVLPSYEDPIETYSTNIMGTVNVLEAIRTVGKVRVVINVTSDKCYENKGIEYNYTEVDPMGGYDPYSGSKGCSELITNSFRNSFFNPKKSENKTSLASVRAGNVIGGGDWSPYRIIPDIVKGLLTHNTIKIRDPSAIRPWQHVLEPLNGYLLLIEKLWYNGPNYADAWNFGPDEKDNKPVSWIVEKFIQSWDHKVNWIYENDNSKHESKYLRLDCTKAKTKLGWHPKINLELALDWTIEWYKKYEEKQDMEKLTQSQIQKFITMN